MTARTNAGILSFVRRIRDAGVPVSTARAIDFLQALDATGIRNQQDVRWTAYATLASHPSHLPLIDMAFDDISFQPVQGDGRDPETPRVTDAVDFRVNVNPDDTSMEEEHGHNVVIERMREPEAARGSSSESRAVVYSALERLREKDFSAYSEEERRDARRFLATIRWDLAERRSRRRRPRKRGHEIDMRRLLRHSLKHGGEVLDLPRRGLKTKQRRLVLICDVSGSMDSYTRMLLHFLHSLNRTFAGMEVFVFGTRLTRITHLIHHRDVDAAVSSIAAEVQDWAGGTRIGDAVGVFNRRWARRVAGHGAITLIISDGWDRGDPDCLRTEMARLQRSSHRLIWLNPLLGSASYQPLTQGMRTALPFVDDFLASHNMASLQDLAVVLNRVQAHRPRRRTVLSADVGAGG